MLTSRSSFLALLFAASLAFAATAARPRNLRRLALWRPPLPPLAPAGIDPATWDKLIRFDAPIATIADLTADFEQTEDHAAVAQAAGLHGRVRHEKW